MNVAPGLEYRCALMTDEHKRVYLLVQSVDKSAPWVVYKEINKYYNISIEKLKKVDHRFYEDILNVAVKDWLYMDSSRHQRLLDTLRGRQCHQCDGSGFIMLLNFWTNCDICNVSQSGKWTTSEVAQLIKEKNESR